MAGFFYMFATLAAAGAVGVVVSRNIVRTAVCLLTTLLGVAGLYFSLEAEFVATVQLVVYAGGTLVLIIFGVMLTSRPPVARFDIRPIELVAAIVIGAVFLVLLCAGILSQAWRAGADGAGAAPPGDYPIARFGEALLGDYLVPFELASVVLLVVMIGSAYLAKARRK